ncbi:MAG: hypothetical protein QOG64_3284, partial [Acidimicrobiaceae bacterium]|nr:hypothetical protein [Acidimicrobiaceae bacterium]
PLPGRAGAIFLRPGEELGEIGANLK